MKITSKTIQETCGFSRQQLYYWRKVGLISTPQKSRELTGQYIYKLEDLQVLKTIKKLQSSGVSTHRIRKCFNSIRKHFPGIESPFAGRPVFVYGSSIVFVHDGINYDAFSGQIYLLDFKKVKGWAGTVVDFLEKKNMRQDEMVFIVEEMRSEQC